MLTSAPPSPPPPNRLNELLGMRFEFPFNLVGRSTMAFLKGESWRVLKSWYTGGAQNKDFCVVSQTDLTRSLFQSVARASEMTGHYR